MAQVNKRGDKRGMSPGSKVGLQKAREVKRKGSPQDPPEKKTKPELPQSLQFTKLIRGSLDQLSPRIREFVKLIESEPGAVTASVLGMMLAEMEAANKTIGKIWDWINKYLDEEDADPRKVTKVLGELRKWSEMLQTSSVKIAEIQKKSIDEVDDGDPLKAYEIEVEPTAPPVDESVEVSLVPHDGTPNEPEKSEEEEGAIDVSFLE